MWDHPRVDGESSIIGARAVLGTDAYHIFPQSVLAVILLIGICLVVLCPEPVLDVWAELPLPCCCHCPSGDGVFS